MRKSKSNPERIATAISDELFSEVESIARTEGVSTPKMFVRLVRLGVERRKN